MVMGIVYYEKTDISKTINNYYTSGFFYSVYISWRSTSQNSYSYS